MWRFRRTTERVINAILEDEGELQKVLSGSLPSGLGGQGHPRWRGKYEQLERSVKATEARVLGIMTPDFKSTFLNKCPQANYWASLCLRLLTYETGNILILASMVTKEIKQGRTCESPEHRGWHKAGPSREHWVSEGCAVAENRLMRVNLAPGKVPE